MRDAGELLLLFLLLFLPAYLQQAPISGTLGAGSLAAGLLGAGPQAALVMYLLWLRREIGRPVFGFRPPVWKDVPRAAVLLVLLLLLAGGSTVAGRLLVDRGDQSLRAAVQWRLENVRLAPLALLFCVVTALREELFFRSYLLARLEGFGVPAGISVAASSLLFSAGHLYQGALAFVAALVMGATLALAFRLLRSVYVNTAAHALYNFAVLLVATLWWPGP